MFLPKELIPILAHFAPAFTEATYQKVEVLVIGILLAKGRRTVTAALRAVGLQNEPGWRKYHHVLNRATWSGLVVSRLLLQLIVVTFLRADSPIIITVDETLERRWGRRIRKRSHWRDSLASSKGMNVTQPASTRRAAGLCITVCFTQPLHHGWITVSEEARYDSLLEDCSFQISASPCRFLHVVSSSNVSH